VTISNSYERRAVRTVVLLVLGALTGCDSKTEWSSGKYSVYWIDARENRKLGRDAGGGTIWLVAPTVVAVGEDETWIVVKRRGPDGREWFYYFGKSADDDSKSGSEVVEGPFKESEFEQRRSKYGLPALQRAF
jgi:hypothetical protein